MFVIEEININHRVVGPYFLLLLLIYIDGNLGSWFEDGRQWDMGT